VSVGCLDFVVLCAKIAASCNEVDMVVGIVIFFELNRL
jgi:hypothetical protein